jgi:hypothetical protein
MTKRELQAAVQAARSGRRRAWLDADLKVALGAYSAERRAAGVRWADLAEELGVGETQLRRWSGERSRRGSKLQRVRVVAAPSAASTGLCLELPGAARVTGLSVADVAALLRALQ